MNQNFDLVVVGAGIVGLATAFRAAQHGLKVAIIEKDARAIGASIRNFGFITVSGQPSGKHWQRAKKSRDIWAEIAPQAGIEICHTGVHFLAQRQESASVLHEFAQTEMGAECHFLSQQTVRAQIGYLKNGESVLYSPHEIRIESQTAIPLFAQWLAEKYAVHFFYQTTVQGVDLPAVHTSRGALQAQYCIVCPGADLYSLFPQHFARANAQLCTLNMLRVMPKKPFKLHSAVLSDLSLARYAGFATLQSGQKLATLLDKTMPDYRQNGIHLIVVQSKDGSLVVGDSHLYDTQEQPFRNEKLDQMMLAEFHRIMNIGEIEVIERWNGVYPSASQAVFIDSPQKNMAIGTITSGSGASTCFAFADELLLQAGIGNSIS